MSNEATYDATLLELSVTRLEVARTWVRHFLRDKPQAEGLQQATRANWLETDKHYSDVEIERNLALAAIVEGTVTYYRPHVTAAQMLKSNPERWQSRSFEYYNEKAADLDAVVAGIMEQGKAFDALIPTHLHTWVEKPKAKKRYYSRTSRYKVHF